MTTSSGGNGGPAQPNIPEILPAAPPPPPAPAIQRIPDSGTAGVYVAQGSQFQSLVANGLGSDGTSGDGWDVSFAVPAGAVDGDATALSVFDTELAALALIPADVVADQYTPLEAMLAAFLATGDTFFNIASSSAGGGPSGGTQVKQA